MAEALPLEYQLIDALLASDHEDAKRIAADLQAQGFDYATVQIALEEFPQLQEPLWQLMGEVIPMSRRAAKRKAIRAAEERDWGNWKDGKKKN